jgi:hypothetical protein
MDKLQEEKIKNDTNSPLIKIFKTTVGNLSHDKQISQWKKLGHEKILSENTEDDWSDYYKNTSK